MHRGSEGVTMKDVLISAVWIVKCEDDTSSDDLDKLIDELGESTDECLRSNVLEIVVGRIGATEADPGANAHRYVGKKP